jgi:hypothetical protein
LPLRLRLGQVGFHRKGGLRDVERGFVFGHFFGPDRDFRREKNIKRAE